MFKYLDKFKVEFFKGWGFSIQYHVDGFSDFGLAVLHIHIIYGSVFITLPWRHDIDESYGERDTSYGVTYHMEALQFYYNRKCKILNLPFSRTWIRTSMLLDDNNWVHSTNKKRIDFYIGGWENKIWKIVLPYKCISEFDGEFDVDVTCTISEREWRQRWLKWTRLGAKVSRDLDVVYSTGLGRGRGSWKGGTIGEGFNIPLGEINIESGLRQMEENHNLKSITMDRLKKIEHIKNNMK